MQFFKVPCPGRGTVSIDGKPQGENKQAGREESDTRQGDGLRIFQCGTGLHDLSMACLVGKRCRRPVQRVQIDKTDPILPMEVPFECAP